MSVPPMSVPSGAVVPRYAVGDERASSVIHGMGIVLSMAGLALLVVVSARLGDARTVIASAVFGVSLIICYTASTLYHSIHGPQAKPALRTFDHLAIFLLIAGTYTPFTLIALPGAWRWGLFSAIWLFALVGCASELGWLKRYRRLAVWMYVAMGWVGIIAFKPLSQYLHGGGMALMLAGGAAYTLGVPFYLWRRLPYHHTVWHGFVLAGSVLHYLTVLWYVIPNTTG